MTQHADLTAAQRDRAHFDKWARRYDRSPLQFVLFEPTHRAAMDAAAAAGAAPRDVLDVGCGTGRLLERAAFRWQEARLTGVDASPDMISEASIKHLDEPRFRFHVGDAAALPLDDSSFDVAFSTVSFHHWADQSRGVREVARVLRPGGLFVLADFAPPLLLGLRKGFHGPQARRTLFEQARLAAVVHYRPLRLAGVVLVTVARKSP
jgi:ubiquinone/menaquinone biosynthesis C-methylase UbiE